MRDEQATDEGRLVRRYRKRQFPELAIRELAARLGWSKEKMGAIELGHTHRVPEHHPSPPDLARIAAELGIPPEELDRAASAPGCLPASAAVLADAAAILRRGAPPAAPDIPAPDILAAAERLLAAAAGRERDDRDREFAGFLVRPVDVDGNPRSPAVRMNALAEWFESIAASAAGQADATEAREAG